MAYKFRGLVHYVHGLGEGMHDKALRQTVAGKDPSVPPLDHQTPGKEWERETLNMAWSFETSEPTPNDKLQEWGHTRNKAISPNSTIT